MLSFGSWKKISMTALLIMAAEKIAAADAKPAALESQKEVILMTVDKATLTAELKTWPAEQERSKVLKKYRIAIGKQDGDKERKGDNRTPEGIYFAETLIDQKLPPEKYGPKAIPLNFPNPMDRADGKTGYGIWLHGAGNDQRIEEAKTTEGCVVFYNSDMEGLGEWIKPYQGIVVIAQDSKLVNTPDEVKDLMQRTQTWAHSWAERKLDDYISFYSPEFAYGGGKRDAYKNYKKTVFSSYKQMTIKFENIRVITHPKYALSIMNQDFNGDQRFISIGRKILYWQKSPEGVWQITRELFDKNKIELVRFAGEGHELSSRQHVSSQAEAAPPNL